MTTGQLILLVSVALAVAFGAWRLRTDGRFRDAGTPADPVGDVSAATSDQAAAAPAPSVLEGTPYADQLGERATLLQFSSAFCAPCRVTRRTLGEVAEVVPGVAHVEVDAELHLDLVRRLDVLRTPTTLVLDAGGREVTRAAGAPGKEQVLTALAMVSTPDIS